ncbi:MAG: hypothetical protein LBK66_12220 [Spirochaetaceae bacterium]|jgi:hypothetical protein|nr:hypothetical protein [Spirochaetaceae bacterium]
MKKTKFLYIFPIVSVVLLFTRCPIEGDQAILTIKNQSSLEITNITIWRGTEALEEAKLKMAEAELNAIAYPSLENLYELLVATNRYNEEVEKTCSRVPEITDDTGLPINAIKSWELKSGSIIVQAACGGKLSSLYIVNFGGDHAVRFIGQKISNPDGNKDDWQ